jgi:hypothetical protein
MSIIDAGTEQALQGAVQGAPLPLSEAVGLSGAAIGLNVVRSAKLSAFGTAGRASVVK